jgi:hypothetical protein
VSDVRIDLKFQAQSKKSMLTIKPALVIGWLLFPFNRPLNMLGCLVPS